MFVEQRDHFFSRLLKEKSFGFVRGFVDTLGRADVS